MHTSSLSVGSNDTWWALLVQRLCSSCIVFGWYVYLQITPFYRAKFNTAWSVLMDFVLAILPVARHHHSPNEAEGENHHSCWSFSWHVCWHLLNRPHYRAQKVSRRWTITSTKLYPCSFGPQLKIVLPSSVHACIPVLRPLYIHLRYGPQGDLSNLHPYPLSKYSNMKNRTGERKCACESIEPDRGDGRDLFQTIVNSGENATTDGAMLEYIKQHHMSNSILSTERGLRPSRDIVVTSTG